MGKRLKQGTKINYTLAKFRWEKQNLRCFSQQTD